VFGTWLIRNLVQVAIMLPLTYVIREVIFNLVTSLFFSLVLCGKLLTIIKLYSLYSLELVLLSFRLN
jgi:hypothetical protein